MAKQMTIPGTKKTTYDDVEKAADRYVEKRDERMELTKEEVKRQAALRAAMEAHKLKTYTLDDGKVVELVEGEAKVKVRAPKPEAAGDGEDGEEEQE